MSPGTAMRIPTSTIPRIITSLLRAEAIDADLAARAPVLIAGPAGVDDVAQRLGVSRELVLKGMADAENMPYLCLDGITPSATSIAAFPEALARLYRCVPLFLNGAELTIAIGEPRKAALDAIRRATQDLELIFVLSDEADVGTLLELCYPSAAEAEVAAYLKQVANGGNGAQRLQEVGGRAPIVRMIDAILERANRLGASDVHLEPFEHESLVRFRKDGLLQPGFTFPAGLHEALVLRLKVLSELNITERQRPQDGRFSHETATGQALEARVSFVRVLFGEKAVVRLLSRGTATPPQVCDLGMPAPLEARFLAMLGRPHGLLLVTGPTGSGKTSTLYAGIRHVNAPTRNVITLEDPVESPIRGVNQIPVRAQFGLTYAGALKAVLRQDPDVVMVGEIRDLETAEVALQGAMTGHLLLATLHTNGAVETITRLLQLGVPPADLAAALVGVVAQRLVRRLCECHGHDRAPAGLASEVGLPELEGELVVPTPRGCLACGLSGYRGRLVIFEVLETNEAIRRLVLSGASGDRLHAAALASGMRPLARAALREVLAGNTSLDEVRRVIHVGY